MRFPMAALFLVLAAVLRSGLSAAVVPVASPSCRLGHTLCTPGTGNVLLQMQQTHGKIAAGGEESETVQSGDEVIVTVARTGARLTVQEDGEVHAKWDHTGGWQLLTIEKADGSGEIHSGDAVYLRGWTGKRVTVQGDGVHAKWANKGDWERLVVERKAGEGPVAFGDTIFLRAWTGAHIDADAADSHGMVQARWSDHGAWQELIIERPSQDAPAQPTIPPSKRLAAHSWEHFQLLNELRAQGFTCPFGETFPPNPSPLKFDCRLWRAAKFHSYDMMLNGYFSHNSQDGRSPWERAQEQDVIANSENIAAGRGTAAGTLEQFKSSPGHCRNMMSASFTVAGVGYAEGGYYGHYWTQMFSLQDDGKIDTTCYPQEAALVEAAGERRQHDGPEALGTVWTSAQQEEVKAGH